MSLFTFDIGTGELYLRSGVNPTLDFDGSVESANSFYNLSIDTFYIDDPVWTGVHPNFNVSSINLGNGNYGLIISYKSGASISLPQGSDILLATATSLGKYRTILSGNYTYDRAFGSGDNAINDVDDGLVITTEGEEAYAGGDPHVKPLVGKKYDLPHTEDTFLMFYNGNSENPITIKSKCWFLPEDKFMDRIEKLEDNGYTERAEKYLAILADATYFKYTEIVCGNESLIIDMDNLSPCRFTTLKDVNNFSLPQSSFVNTSNIIMSNIKCSRVGILDKKLSRSTLERVITIVDGDRKIYLRLMKDSRNMIQRNGIRLNLRLSRSDSGALVRKDIVVSEFGDSHVATEENEVTETKLAYEQEKMDDFEQDVLSNEKGVFIYKK